MAPNEKLFKKSYAPELLRIAQEDFKTAIFLATSVDIRKENILFHLEQSVEKALMAVLCFKGVEVPLTHDLYAIVQRFSDRGLKLPPTDYALHDLTPFATVRRYEEGQYEIMKDDVQHALKIGQEVLDWCANHLESAI
jgi:HEPN domain-containing protein